MTRIFFIPIFILSAVLLISFNGERSVSVEDDFKLAEQQYMQIIKSNNDASLFPKTTGPDQRLKSTNLREWTSGFWPGNLWYIYEYTQKSSWKKEAENWTNALKANENNKTTHDLGFMMYCSYGNAYRLTGNKQYKDVLIQSAKSLASRFNSNIGCIESWDSRESWDKKTFWGFPVIIDNMMNLELLFFASKETGNRDFYDIAVKHAEITMKNHLRPDYSSYHVVDYDTTSGKVLARQTFQGFSDNSTWSRGQAWGIYGFTMVYRETKDKRFLKTAQKMADYFLNHKNLPADMVPYWDFNVAERGYKADWNYLPEKRDYKIRDASAAAITSSALFELSRYSSKSDSLRYLNAAKHMLSSLSSAQYKADFGANNGFLLKHAVGSFPHNSEIDVPLIYADYYFLEALLRYRNLKNK